MQVANSILAQTSRDIKAGIRSTSCNRGWLQFFTHLVCGTFTVTSFIMILVLTLNISKKPPINDESRCQLAGCHVVCHEAPFYEEREDDIVLAVMVAEVNCKNVFLTLREPKFTNESLPLNWLSRLRPVVVELDIVGGNLHYTPHNAFSSAFARSLRLLHLEKITVASWTQYSLLGLVNLENISIKRCNIIDMPKNLLSAVSQTLATLTVVESGYWNPENLTGSSQLASFSMLTSVDLSSNDFGASLGRASFARLSYCKSLYLGSNRISYIEPGAFDKLVKLEDLNLSDNLLTHIEPGLFNFMTSSSKPRVRLNLINNLWHCNCSDTVLRQLIRLAILLVDPTCNSPKGALGKTFHEFISFCKENEPKQIVAVDMRHGIVDNSETVIENLKCVSTISPEITPKLVSPFYNYPCSVDVLNSSSSQLPSTLLADFYNTNDNFWVKPVVAFIGENFTMIEFSFSGTEGYGLMWYRNSCRNEVFCINILPDTIRLYNIDLYNEYTFCPVVLTSGTVDSTQCVGVASDNRRSSFITKLILIPLTAVSCILFGALTLYMLIRKYPYLLKGSKRLLFVKHKTVDALVLPPKVPLRDVQSDASLDNSKAIFDISARLSHDIKRSGSVRSTHSIAPSYISALQPTEEQLADWRFKHASERYDNYYATISTISSNMQFSMSSGDSDHLYFSIKDDSPIISISDLFSQNLETEPVSVS